MPGGDSGKWLKTRVKNICVGRDSGFALTIIREISDDSDGFEAEADDLADEADDVAGVVGAIGVFGSGGRPLCLGEAASR